MESFSEEALQPVESYNEFLEWMEQRDYGGNRVVVCTSGLTSAPQPHTAYLPTPYSRSYPPSGTRFMTGNPGSSNRIGSPSNNGPPISGGAKFYSLQIDLHSAPANEAHQIDWKKQIEQIDLEHIDLDDLDGLMVDDDDEDEDEVAWRLDTEEFPHIGLFPTLTPREEMEDEQEQEQAFLDSHQQTQSNPVAPGLFPQMDLSDESQFSSLDMLPLNPSYIMP
ncbi:hypothetical protein PSN45_002202 [Yamadazyma tenuis]|uniref:Uncharacterized protein n=1 Tax=Candida tenuis (strain ATCC 10573 / BCRC 21748 / CBS 615 / JCM 9827 / NBRC 10315 / NRRL Y-1498 / VKM Y-70) TaxID=590646 RepID=G3BFN5_CANTC|nr:uncharacterized protein CANTEDRAFT_116088 [Yamadazyma tenuis ATCC 10573]EGV60060.1 hypothetical protein CANTEDRAFT_116088 [Yamadazyma tenuis ATCC 10573]WEJ94708.1 hypothetical protein PSN45_002202 [Yamadazyma tenuis]